MYKHVLTAAVAALFLSGTAVAHEAGDVVLRVGAVHVAPDVSSSKVKLGGVKQPGTGVDDVKSDTQFGLTATYMVMPHFGLELLAATPFTHKVKLKNGSETIDFGKVTQLPPTLSAQFFFLSPKSAFQPYVGLGVNYTVFYDEKLSSDARNMGFSKFKMENSVGLAAQVGMDYKIGDRLFLNAAVWKLGISSTGKARVGAANTPVEVDVDINPWVYFLGAGFRF